MPRPTAAQLVYGSCTVIFCTLAMLLLSQTSSGVGITVIALSALALGLLVARTVPLPRRTPAAAGPAVTPAAAPVASTVVEQRVPAERPTVSVGASEPVREPANP